MEHHEKWDGTGYPNGLYGENIHIYARITAAADVFDALTSERPYKDAWSNERAVELLRTESGGHFDPMVIQAFLKCLDNIYAVKETYRDYQAAIITKI